MRIPILLCLATTACASTAADVARRDARAAEEQAEVAKALAGLTPGEPTTCLSAIERRTARAETHGTTILYRVGSDRVYRNDMNGNCDQLSRDPIMVTQTPSGALCRGDIAQLVDRGSRVSIGACAYGPFVPYRRTS